MPYTKAFSELLTSMNKQYLGDRVPHQYQSKYGKRYDKKDVKSFAYAVANSRGIPIDVRRSR